MKRVTSTALFVVIFLTCAYAYAFAFAFAVLGDNRDGDEIYKKLLAKINSDKEISFIFNTGDFVSRGSQSEYDKYLKLIKPFGLPIYHVIGNHDAVFLGWKRFAKIFGPSYYSMDHENSHFVVLDNAFKDSFDEKQFNWLIGDLKNNKQKYTFIFFHKPVFDSTGTTSDHLMDSRRQAERLIGVFNKYKVDYVFSGHIHGYGRAKRDGVVYIITGGGGAPLYLPNYLGGFNHYVKITVGNDKIEDKVVRLDD